MLLTHIHFEEAISPRVTASQPVLRTLHCHILPLKRLDIRPQWVHAVPSGGAIWFGGDDVANSNSISLTGCTLSANNAQYGGALYGAAGARMLVGTLAVHFTLRRCVASI